MLHESRKYFDAHRIQPEKGSQSEIVDKIAECCAQNSIFNRKY